MSSAGRLTLKTFAILVVLSAFAYGSLCVYAYAAQETWLFAHGQLAPDYAFTFDRPFVEKRIPYENAPLDGLLFTTAEPRGLVVAYSDLRGNARDTAMRLLPSMTQAGYELFVADYPGFGKSRGSISSEAQLFAAADAIYRWLRDQYPESRMVIVGEGMGAAPAAFVACHHHPQRLMLIAPVPSVAESVRRRYPFLPLGLLRYPLRTDVEMTACQTPLSTFAENYRIDVGKLLDAGVKPLAAPPVGVKIR